MNTGLKSALLFLGLIALVGLGVYFTGKSRSIPPEPAAQPPAERNDLHPRLQVALEAIEGADLDRARKELLAVPPTDASYTVALHNLATVDLRQGNAAAANETLQRLLEIQPNNPEVHASLAWVRFRLESYADAEYSALRALELAPGHIAAHFDIGLYRLAQGRLSDAIDSYHRAVALPDAGAAIDRAFERLQQFHETHADEAPVHYAVAYFANTLGRPDIEVDELEHFLALTPEGAAAENARARLTEATRRIPQ